MNDVKVIKRKIKKAEKDTQRELKKDTQVIMQEKARQADQRRKGHKVYRGGNMPKDEVWYWFSLFSLDHLIKELTELIIINN